MEVGKVIGLRLPVQTLLHPYTFQGHQLGICSLMDESKSVWYSIMLNFQTNVCGDFKSSWSSF